MYIFGGKGDDVEKMNDLWVFDYDQQTWTELIVENPEYMPIPRSGHSTEVYGDFIVIFGGIHEVTKELDDCAVYSIKRNEWICINEEASQLRKLNSPSIERGSSTRGFLLGGVSTGGLRTAQKDNSPLSPFKAGGTIRPSTTNATRRNQTSSKRGLSALKSRSSRSKNQHTAANSRHANTLAML